MNKSCLKHYFEHFKFISEMAYNIYLYISRIVSLAKKYEISEQSKQKSICIIFQRILNTYSFFPENHSIISI
jgi:hypothetical protein